VVDQEYPEIQVMKGDHPVVLVLVVVERQLNHLGRNLFLPLPILNMVMLEEQEVVVLDQQVVVELGQQDRIHFPDRQTRVVVLVEMVNHSQHLHTLLLV
tara:strand:+ start:72 stop:368 length:297 start_codon:yes stop_codon:yes gene_type:complete